MILIVFSCCKQLYRPLCLCPSIYLFVHLPHLLSWSQGTCKVFVVSALWLSAYWTESLFGRNISHTVAMCHALYPGQKSRSHRSFEVKVTLVFWNLCVSPRGSVPIWRIRFICGTSKTHGETMCCASFHSQKVKFTQVVHFWNVFWRLRGGTAIKIYLLSCWGWI